MTHTTNYNLNKFESSDRFDLSKLNDNMDILDGVLGGLSFKKLTKAEYEALETKSDTTLYFVTDGSKVLMYLGETELKSGTVNEGLATIMAAGTAESPAGAAT